MKATVKLTISISKTSKVRDHLRLSSTVKCTILNNNSLAVWQTILYKGYMSYLTPLKSGVTFPMLDINSQMFPSVSKWVHVKKGGPGTAGHVTLLKLMCGLSFENTLFINHGCYKQRPNTTYWRSFALFFRNKSRIWHCVS